MHSPFRLFIDIICNLLWCPWIPLITAVWYSFVVIREGTSTLTAKLFHIPALLQMSYSTDICNTNIQGSTQVTYVIWMLHGRSPFHYFILIYYVPTLEQVVKHAIPLYMIENLWLYRYDVKGLWYKSNLMIYGCIMDYGQIILWVL